MWDTGAPLEWVFEFGMPSSTYYSLAILALEAKCRKIFTEHHAMLVGFIGAATTEVRVWLLEEKLGIVLLVSHMS
jgi:hypothetical protein